MDPIDKLKQLTKREREVLALYAQGLEYKDIAAKLFITVAGVKSHVNHIYQKLQLNHLPRNARLIAIREDYFPLLDKLSASEEEEEEVGAIEIIDPLSPEMEQMIEEDVNAIRALQVVEPTPLVELNQPSRRSPFRWLFRISLLVLVIVGIGAVLIFNWGTIQDIVGRVFPAAVAFQDETPTSTLPADAMASAVAETLTHLLTSATLPPVSSSTITPADTLTVVPSATSPPTNTLPPTLTFTPTPLIPGPVVEFGDWYEENNIAIRLLEYDVIGTRIDFEVEVWNKSDKTIFFSWTAASNFLVIDNLGRKYTSHYNSQEQTQIEVADRRILIMGAPQPFTASYNAEFVYEEEVTDVYLRAENISHIEVVYFHVTLGQ